MLDSEVEDWWSEYTVYTRLIRIKVMKTESTLYFIPKLRFHQLSFWPLLMFLSCFLPHFKDRCKTLFALLFTCSLGFTEGLLWVSLIVYLNFITNWIYLPYLWNLTVRSEKVYFHLPTPFPLAFDTNTHGCAHAHTHTHSLDDSCSK